MRAVEEETFVCRIVKVAGVVRVELLGQLYLLIKLLLSEESLPWRTLLESDSQFTGRAHNAVENDFVIRETVRGRGDGYAERRKGPVGRNWRLLRMGLLLVLLAVSASVKLLHLEVMV